MADRNEDGDARGAKVVLLRDYTLQMGDRIASLRGRASGDSTSDLLAEAFQELEVTREELTVADEELLSAALRFEEMTRVLEARVRHYGELFDGSPDGYLLTDPLGIVREGNRTAAAMLGVHKAFFEGKPLVNFVARNDVRAYRASLAALLRDKGTDRELVGEAVFLRMRPRDGKPPFVAEVMRRAVRGPSGSVTSIRWTLRKALAPDGDGSGRREPERDGSPDSSPGGGA